MKLFYSSQPPKGVLGAVFLKSFVRQDKGKEGVLQKKYCPLKRKNRGENARISRKGSKLSAVFTMDIGSICNFWRKNITFRHFLSLAETFILR